MHSASVLDARAHVRRSMGKQNKSDASVLLGHICALHHTGNPVPAEEALSQADAAPDSFGDCFKANLNLEFNLSAEPKTETEMETSHKGW